MKSLFIKSERYVCDECSAGDPFPSLRLSSNIFLAGAYCQKQGLDVDVLLVPAGGSYSYDNYDVVVAWVPLLEGFFQEIKYLEKAKKERKITIMILNDPFEDLEMEAMEKYPFIDYVVRLSEREIVLEELLKELEKSQKERNLSFSGIIYRDGRKIINNGKRPPLANLEHLPPTTELLKKIDFSRYDHVFLEAGRGCPYFCSFCFYRQTKMRKRKIEDLISELKVIGDKVGHIWLHDLNMMVEPKWVENLCEKIIKRGIKSKWGTDVRLNHCIQYPDLLKKMGEAGCHLLALGIESADNKILEKIGKKIEVKDINQGVKNCLEAGIKPLLNLMVGFPWDTNETLKEMENLLYKLDYNEVDFQFVRPLRGTPLYQEYKKLGLLKRDLTIDDYVYIRRKELALSAPLFPTLSLNQERLKEWDQKLKQIVRVKKLKRGLQSGKNFIDYSKRIFRRLFKEGFNLRLIKDYLRIFFRMLK